MIKNYLTDDIITVSSNNKKDTVSINIKNEDNLYETIIEFKRDEFDLETIENFQHKDIIVCTGWEKGVGLWQKSIIAYDYSGEKISSYGGKNTFRVSQVFIF